MAQLKDIYLCKTTNWAKVGGKSAPIKPFLPQPASGLTASWLTALGGGKTPITPGACVSDEGGTLQDNQGISAVLDSPNAIVPYSVASYLAQAYHDAPCAKSSCTGSPACKPTGSQNLFGCDEHGVLGLGEIDYKGPGHPHTNMAKAALNMLTRTSAREMLESDRILMSSVDTGWITDERPHTTRMRLADEGFHAPLDLSDGAARVYDPIVRGEAGEDLHGVFLKDYAPAVW